MEKARMMGSCQFVDDFGHFVDEFITPSSTSLNDVNEVNDLLHIAGNTSQKPPRCSQPLLQVMLCQRA
jgi:hypothetical protein